MNFRACDAVRQTKKEEERCAVIFVIPVIIIAREGWKVA
jgi:hypothetical protein